MNHTAYWSLLFLWQIFNPILISAQDATVGLITNQSFDDGFVLFNPLSHKTTYLINRKGEVVKTWKSEFVPGLSVCLAADGSLYRAGRVTDDTYLNSGGAGGIIERFNWDGDLIWQYRYSSPTVRQHHDFELMPDGHVLLVAWEKKTRAEAEMAGRNPGAINANQLWPDHIVEIEPTGFDSGNIFWEWHVWDHLVQQLDPSKDNFGMVKDHPELIDINHYQNAIADWIHGNSITYNTAQDQIMLSSRAFNELWIIDHSTTSAQAASHAGGRSRKGGDLLWRWGNPMAYGRASESSQRFFGQHGIDWLWSHNSDTSQVMVYNNGNGRKPAFHSSIERIKLVAHVNGTYPLDLDGLFLPSVPNMIFIPDDTLAIFAPLFSNVTAMNHGGFLVCVGPRGTFIEYDRNSNEIWKYVNPVTESGKILNQGESIGNHQASINSVFNINYYPSEFAGFDGRKLSSQGVLEGQLATSIKDIEVEMNLYPNPLADYLYLASSASKYLVELCDSQGRVLRSLKYPDDQIYVGDFPSGIYYCRSNGTWLRKIIKL